MKAYLSNLSPRWPLGKQEALFSAHIPGWPKVSTYCDTLTASARKAHNPSSLHQRAAMLRPTARNTNGEVIYVASLACFAWGVVDFTDTLTVLTERGATLIALDADLTIQPNAKPTQIGKAVKAFTAAKRTVTGGGAIVGAMASAKTRRAVTDAAIAKIKDRWPMPSKEFPTTALLAEAGLSLNTVIDRLGNRPAAQKARQAAIKLQARRKQ